MYIFECPSCQQRQMVGIPKTLPELKARICRYCGEEWLIDVLEFRDSTVQGLSADGTRIQEPIYTHAQLAKLLGIHPRTLFKWRKQGRIDCYRLGSSVFYGESHVRAFLCLHFEPFPVQSASRADIEAALSCMRNGCSPFSLQDFFKCGSGHWLTHKQLLSYDLRRVRDRTMDASSLNNKIKLMWYGPRRKLLFLTLH